MAMLASFWRKGAGLSWRINWPMRFSLDSGTTLRRNSILNEDFSQNEKRCRSGFWFMVSLGPHSPRRRSKCVGAWPTPVFLAFFYSYSLRRSTTCVRGGSQAGSSEKWREELKIQNPCRHGFDLARVLAIHGFGFVK